LTITGGSTLHKIYYEVPPNAVNVCDILKTQIGTIKQEHSVSSDLYLDSIIRILEGGVLHTDVDNFRNGPKDLERTLRLCGALLALNISMRDEDPERKARSTEYCSKMIEASGILSLRLSSSRLDTALEIVAGFEHTLIEQKVITEDEAVAVKIVEARRS